MGGHYVLLEMKNQCTSPIVNRLLVILYPVSLPRDFIVLPSRGRMFFSSPWLWALSCNLLCSTACRQHNASRGLLSGASVMRRPAVGSSTIPRKWEMPRTHLTCWNHQSCPNLPEVWRQPIPADEQIHDPECMFIFLCHWVWGWHSKQNFVATIDWYKSLENRTGCKLQVESDIWCAIPDFFTAAKFANCILSTWPDQSSLTFSWHPRFSQ